MDWQTIAIAVFGAGGLVQLIATIRDWMQGRAQRQEDSEERYQIRLEREIQHLRFQLQVTDEYVIELVNALIDAGIKVPVRAKVEEVKK